MINQAKLAKILNESTDMFDISNVDLEKLSAALEVGYAEDVKLGIKKRASLEDMFWSIIDLSDPEEFGMKYIED